ncbi:MAG TPA: exopolysaccharide biosynthesis polyprenyl glycosylphosphotransferase [Solirubrobacteraceae bacterium]
MMHAVAQRPLRRRATAAARHTETVQGLLMAADAAAGAFALGVGAQMLGGAVLTPVAILAPILVVPLARTFGLYAKPGRGLGRSTLLEVPRLAQLATLLTLLAYLASTWLVAGSWHVGTTVALWASLLVALPVGRAAARRAPAALAPERCLVIGSLERWDRVRRTIHGLSGGRSLVVGWIAPDQVELGSDGWAALREAIEYHDAEHVVVAPAVADSGETLVLIRALEELEVRVTVLPRLLELASATLTSDVVGAAAALDVRRLGLARSERVVKRTLDVLGAATLLLLLAPAAALIALIVRATTSGPVLFRQLRIGRDGREFTMWKFRTMVRDAETEKAELRSRNEADGLFKMADDPRVTRVGRFLRRTSLDELPQLFNVLRGHMSLVGPRPLVPEEDGAIAGWHRRRLYMRPGMTGVWQVMGSARVPMHEMVELDNLYVLSWSPWLDLKILLRTLGFVLARRGL